MTQNEAIEIIMKGHNVFLTGAAGAGKTWVLNKCIENLKEKGKKIAITATTGIAATHIDGITIHSWSRIGIKTEKDLTDEHIFKSIVHDKYSKRNILASSILIIDEISMLHAYQFTAIDNICRSIRKNPDVPFGGLQVILSGDFFQLPPISKEYRIPVQYALQSPSWKEGDFKICYLEEQYRQVDENFTKILTAIRNNSLSGALLQLLMDRIDAPIESNTTPVKLYPKNLDIDRINKEELDKIDEPVFEYVMESSGPDPLVETLKGNCIAKENLELKVGAPVLFIKNNKIKGYINGTQGIVIGFKGIDTQSRVCLENGESLVYPVVETTEGKIIDVLPATWSILKYEIHTRVRGTGEEEMFIVDVPLASIIQLPLILGWALTIHKAMGMSLDCAEMDLSQSFENGMGYVALSRVRKLSGILLRGINKIATQVDPRMIKVDHALIGESEKNRLELCSCYEEEEYEEYEEYEEDEHEIDDESLECFKRSMEKDDREDSRLLKEPIFNKIFPDEDTRSLANSLWVFFNKDDRFVSYEDEQKIVGLIQKIVQDISEVRIVVSGIIPIESLSQRRVN